MRRVHFQQNTLDWLSWRQEGIGSSDIAAIMGKSPFCTAIKVYYQKSGLADSPKVTIAMSRGVLYEAEAREEFFRRVKTDFFPVCCVHEEKEHFIASLDGYNEKDNEILEIKIPGRKTMDIVVSGKIPEYYIIQMQWQMMVSGACEGYFCCYMPETREMHTIKIKRDEDLITELREKAILFWKNFKRGIPPT